MRRWIELSDEYSEHLIVGTEGTTPRDASDHLLVSCLLRAGLESARDAKDWVDKADIHYVPGPDQTTWTILTDGALDIYEAFE